MNDTRQYQWLADLVLSVHFAVVLFVVGGLAFIVVGGLCRWRLAFSLRFRLAHLAAIALVAAQAWLGAICPLTRLEMWLRDAAGQPTYSGSFVGHWLQRLLYYEAPSWVFTVAYSLFGLLVLASWRIFPPRRRQRVPRPVASPGQCTERSERSTGETVGVPSRGSGLSGRARADRDGR